MKKFALSLALILSFLNVSAQRLHLKIQGNSEKENTTIDSVSYNGQHPDLKSLNAEISGFSEKLIRLGYIENEILESKKEHDTLYSVRFSLGKKTGSLHIYMPKAVQEKTTGIFETRSDTTRVAFAEAENFMRQTLSKLESKGYSLARIRLDNFRKIKNALYAELLVETGKKREVNDIVIKGYEKFPEGHKANIRRLYRNKTFNQENLKKIHADFEKFRFVTQTKYPEILFTKDTTKVYVYLEKSKPNKFEGFVGFSNDDEKDVTFNGYLDLLLVNLLNSGEEFSLYWKSDGKQQKTFNAGIELPYVFKSPFGLKASLNIFKQDSTFQNTKTAIDLGYYFNYNSRLYIGYEATESSDIQNANTARVSDYTNTFYTATFEYADFKADDFLFPEKTKISIRAGFGSRDSKLQSDRQVMLGLDAKHAVYFNDRNSFNLRTQDFYLNSGNYIINELYRFGGINSIRGFNENSLQASQFVSLLTEYRYRITTSLYVHTIFDYGYFNDESIEKDGNLLGIGFGFGLLTKNGLLNLIYANGSVNQQEIKLSNSIVHISFKTSF